MTNATEIVRVNNFNSGTRVISESIVYTSWSIIYKNLASNELALGSNYRLKNITKLIFRVLTICQSVFYFPTDTESNLSFAWWSMICLTFQTVENYFAHLVS